MRISTTQFYEVTTQNYQRSYASVAKTSQEISSGVKLNTASDDPVGAARVLQLTQQNSMLTQYKSNISVINTNISNSETVLSSIVSAIQNAKDLVIKAGNGSYTDADRTSTAAELKEVQKEILGLMNSQDSNGQYIFSGTRSSEPPYSMNSDGTYTYNGDQTTIDLAVGDGLKMPSNVTGWEAFEKSINTTRVSSAITAGPNDGKAGVTNGLVKSTSTYNASFQGGEPYKLTFISGTEFQITDKDGNDLTSETSTAGKFSYSNYDNQAFTFRGVEMNLNINLTDAEKATAATASAVLATRSFEVASTPSSVTASRSPGNTSPTTITQSAVGTTAADKAAFNTTFPSSGASLRFSTANGYELYASPYKAGDTAVAPGVVAGSVVKAAGVEFTIAGGPPNDGDVFVIESGTHQTENILNTLSAAIKAISAPADGSLVATQALNSALTSALGNLSASTEQVSSAVSAGGARQSAATAQGSTNELLLGNNSQESSLIVSTDLVEATTRLTLQKTMLEASQMVFSQLSKLNLFSQL